MDPRNFRLEDTVALWNTPRSSEAEHPGRVAVTGRKDAMSLTQQANVWRTPQASDGKRGGLPTGRRN